MSDLHSSTNHHEQPQANPKSPSQLLRDLSLLSLQLQKHAQEASSAFLSQECPSDISVYHDYFRKLAGLLKRLEKYLWAYCDTNHYNRYEALQFLTESKNKNTLCRCVKHTDDCLILHLPHLPHRSFSGRNIATESLAAYLFRHRDLPRWNRWHCEFLHVFPCQLSRLPKDVDNYGYKRVIDLLAFAMGVSDGAACCSLSMDAVFSDSVPEGCYIKVSPKSSENPVFKEIENLNPVQEKQQ